MALLSRARIDPQPEAISPEQRGPALHQVFGRLRFRVYLVRAVVRRVSLQNPARISDLAGWPRNEAIARQPTSLARRQRHSDDVLVVPGRRQARLQHALHKLGAPAQEAACAFAIAPHSAVALGRVCFLEEGIRWSAGGGHIFHRRAIAFSLGHLNS